MSCCDDDLASRFVEGALASEQRAVVAAHLAGCEPCRELIAALALGPTGDGSGHARHEALAKDDEDPFVGVNVGRYHLTRRLGAGAMGIVYRAHDRVLQRDVAIKLVRHLDAPVLRDQLIAAARAMARVDHPNVLPIYDAGHEPSDAGDEVFVAMALVEGGDLRAWSQTRRPLRPMLRKLAALADGLAAIHDAGVLHRDIKPDNVLVAADRLVLADVGFAGATDEEGGATVQTPAYLAPEIRRGGEATAASDQYALAVTMVEALVGQRPSSMAEARALLAAASVPRQASRAIVRALDPEPGARHGSARAFAAALSPRRGRMLAVTAAMVVTALASFGLSARLRERASDADAIAPCGQTVLAAMQAWGEHREVLTQRFAAATSAWQPLARHLDAYVERLAELRATQCTALAAGDETAHARLACLADRARALDGMRFALHSVAPDALPDGPDAASMSSGMSLSMLPSLRGCDVATPSSHPQPPPELAAEAMAIERDIAAASALAELGEYERAETGARSALRSAEALGLEATIARAHHVLGGVAAHRGDETLARLSFQHAAEAAERSGYDSLRANALLALLALPGLGATDVDALSRRARAVVTRIDDPELWALFHTRYGVALVHANRLEEARAEFAASVAITRDSWGPDDPGLALAYGNLASAHVMLGEREEAREVLQRALAVERSAFGEKTLATARTLASLATVAEGDEVQRLTDEALAIFRLFEPGTDTVQALTNACDVHTRGGRPDALELCREAVSVAEQVYGADHPALAWPLTGLGLALISSKRSADAVDVLERGLALVSDTPRFPMERADLEYALALALSESRKHRERALELARAAKAQWGTSAIRREQIPEVEQLIVKLEAPAKPRR